MELSGGEDRRSTRRPTAIAHYRLGMALKKRKRHDQAALCFRRALALDPGLASAEVGLGHALHRRGDLDQAVRSFRRALAIQPESAEAHYRLGNTLCEQGRIAAALECYRNAIALKADYAAALSNLAFTMNYHAEASPSEIYDAHRARAALFPSLEKLNRHHPNDRNPERRLRIGYVSGDFCEHAMLYFLEPLFASHNHAAFEVFCYSALDEPEEDEITTRLKRYADRWVSISRSSDSDAAERIGADRIDVLVDLGGYTTRNRLGVFALKPAPVQATWQGYLNTTGLAAMDYRITDAIEDPEGEADRYNSEALIRLKPLCHCYRPLDNALPVSAPPVLHNGRLTFGSFNNLSKLTPDVIRLWAALLRGVPGSRMVIKTEQMRDTPTADALRARFAEEGISHDRIDLLAWRVKTAHHLARYGLIDVALDPFPFNGVTTTCEALWMGVPVVAMRGDRPYGRVGENLLTAVGLAEFVAADPESYVRIAASFAGRISRLTELRFSLRERVRNSPLCDEAGFARTMEECYRGMWRNWCVSAGSKPAALP